MADPPAAANPKLPFPLRAGERVIELCRRHWWHLWPRTIIWLLFALVPVIAAVWLLSALDVLDDLGIFFWAVVAVWLAYWAVRLLLNWYRYHNVISVVAGQPILTIF